MRQIQGGGMVDFVAIDVETANPNMASICQIGLAAFREDKIVLEWKSLVDPKDGFSPVNVSIHGITEDMVAGSPTFPNWSRCFDSTWKDMW